MAHGVNTEPLSSKHRIVTTSHRTEPTHPNSNGTKQQIKRNMTVSQSEHHAFPLTSCAAGNEYILRPGAHSSHDDASAVLLPSVCSDEKRLERPPKKKERASKRRTGRVKSGC